MKVSEKRNPVVTFRIADDKGTPLDRTDLGELRFTIAAAKADGAGVTTYQSYVLSKVPGREYVYKGERGKPLLADTLQPDYGREGAFARLRPGVFTYTL